MRKLILFLFLVLLTVSCTKKETTECVECRSIGSSGDYIYYCGNSDEVSAFVAAATDGTGTGGHGKFTCTQISK